MTEQQIQAAAARLRRAKDQATLAIAHPLVSPPPRLDAADLYDNAGAKILIDNEAREHGWIVADWFIPFLAKHLNLAFEKGRQASDRAFWDGGEIVSEQTRVEATIMVDEPISIPYIKVCVNGYECGHITATKSAPFNELLKLSVAQIVFDAYEKGRKAGEERSQADVRKAIGIK